MRQYAMTALLMGFALTAAAQQQPAKEMKQKVALPATGRPTDDQIKALNECSLARVNGNCQYIINRETPVVPSTAIQMYSGQRLVVIVKNEHPFERYFLDPVSGQLTQNPDTAATIVQAMLPALAKVNLERQVTQKAQTYGLDFILGDPCEDQAITQDLPDGGVDGVLLQFKVCIAKLGHDAKLIYSDLEPYTAPDAITPKDVSKTNSLEKIGDNIDKFIAIEAKVSNRMKAIADARKTPPDAKAVADLLSYQKPADAVAADLLGYRTRINDLDPVSSQNPNGFSNQAVLCRNLIEAFEKDNKTKCVAVASNADDAQPYQGMVTRTITYALDTYNLVSYSQQAAVDSSKKKVLGGNFIINFADEPNVSKSPALKWEASAGVFFSSLPIRSFSVAPVFDGTNVTDNLVTQTILRPTVISYAAGNYRLTNDIPWSKWKSNLYLTGAIGINPNTVSADFAAGLSLSWRTLMFSPLWHYGHDTRLNGFTVGEKLGAGFKSTLPTQTFWTSSFGIGIGIRIPPIAGR